MSKPAFPQIDLVATGANIKRLREKKGMSVQAVQAWFEFNEPRTVYKWQSGEALPSVDNLFALSELFGVSMNEIIVRQADPNRLKEPMKDGSVFLPRMAV